MTASLSSQPSSFEGYVFFQRLAQDVSTVAAHGFLGWPNFEFRMPPAKPRSRIASVNTTGLIIPTETIPENRLAPDYRPRTELGRRLMELRAQIVASGERLLDWDDVNREVAERRGGARVDNYGDAGVR